jgi:hypothetical protein
VTSRTHDQEPRAIDRRRLVRTGATLAWAVPAVQLAAAAPALAVSGCCTLSATGTPNWRPKSLNYIDIPLQITNGCVGAVAGLTVTLTICGVDGLQMLGSDDLPAGWTQTGKPNKPLPPDSNGCYTVTFVTAQSLAGNTTIYPQFTLKTQAYVGTGNHRPAGTVAVTVSTNGCTSPTTVLPLPKVG